MTGDERDTHVKRGRIPHAVRVALWAANAGRCSMCNEHVSGEDHSWYHTVLTGEMAHNIGATTGAGSPRGAEPIDNRESLENLLLLCHDCHRHIDDPQHEDLYTTDVLREIKRQHEAGVARLTQGLGLPRVAVLRVSGNVRGSYGPADRHDVGEVLIGEGLLPLVESQVHGDFESRIQGDENDPGYWTWAQTEINKKIDKVMQAVESEHITNLAVFAFAPIPVLVHVGSALDDKVPTRVFQRQPHGDWRWPGGDVINFEHSVVPGDSSDIVLAVGLSATINPERLPATLRTATRLTLSPVSVAPSRDLLTSEDSLIKFREAFSAMLTKAEELGGSGARWHLVAATGVAASVQMGRALMRDAQPAVAVYQLSDNAYIHVLDVNTPKGQQ